MNSIDVRTSNAEMGRITSFEGLRFTIRTDGNNALYVQPMPETWERDYGDDKGYMRQNFPYTFKLKVQEKRDGSIVYVPHLSANVTKHYGTRVAWIILHTLRSFGMKYSNR